MTGDDSKRGGDHHRRFVGAVPYLDATEAGEKAQGSFEILPKLEFRMGEEDTLVQRVGGPGAKRRRGRAFLTVLSGREVGTTHRLGSGESMIGRGADVDVQIVDEGVSRRHAKIVRDLDGTSKIIDLRSTNGTFVNGKRIDIEALREGDRIRIGASATLDFRYEYLGSLDGEDADQDARPEPGALRASGGEGNDPSLRELQRTLEIREDSFGADHPAVAAILDTFACKLRAAGQVKEALTRHERAIEIYEKRIAGGPEPPELAHLLASQGETLLLAGQGATALSTFERALEMLEKRAAEESELAPVRFGVARSLSVMGREPLRARTLAQLARDGFVQTTGGGGKADEVDRWLAATDW